MIFWRISCVTRWKRFIRFIESLNSYTFKKVNLNGSSQKIEELQDFSDMNLYIYLLICIRL